MTWTFGELEARLAEMHQIAPAKRTAFQARLKNFHRLNFPADLRSEKGRPTLYGPPDVVQMAIALELAQIGLPPDLIVGLIGSHQVSVAVAVGGAAENICSSVAPTENSFFLIIEPWALVSLSTGQGSKLRAANLATLSNWMTGAGWRDGLSRAMIVNLTELFTRMALDDMNEAFFGEVIEWSHKIIGPALHRVTQALEEGIPTDGGLEPEDFC